MGLYPLIIYRWIDRKQFFRLSFSLAESSIYVLTQSADSCFPRNYLTDVTGHVGCWAAIVLLEQTPTKMKQPRLTVHHGCYMYAHVMLRRITLHGRMDANWLHPSSSSCVLRDCKIDKRGGSWVRMAHPLGSWWPEGYESCLVEYWVK